MILQVILHNSKQYYLNFPLIYVVLSACWGLFKKLNESFIKNPLLLIVATQNWADAFITIALTSNYRDFTYTFHTICTNGCRIMFFFFNNKKETTNILFVIKLNQILWTQSFSLIFTPLSPIDLIYSKPKTRNVESTQQIKHHRWGDKESKLPVKNHSFKL